MTLDGMLLKELRRIDAYPLNRKSTDISPLTYNGEVTSLTWPQVTDIKILDRQVVDGSGFIKFWKFENIWFRTAAVVRAQTFLEARSRDSNWWRDLMLPRQKKNTKHKIDLKNYF